MVNTTRRFKDAIYERLALVGKSLASGPRLEILDLLCQGPRTVEVVAAQVNQSVANTSHHLQVLRRASLVETEKNGVYITYKLAGEEVCALFRALRRLAETHLAEIEQVTHQFLEERGAMEPVDLEELVQRIRCDEVTVLDVRPSEEYRAGHIPGALSVPLSEIEKHLTELPRKREIVAYCRGPYCVMALEAVEVLRANGFQAIRFEEGVPDWRARGVPVEGSLA